jgi:hypothetical protein
MTPCEHTLDQPGIVFFHGNDGQHIQLEYDHTQLEALSERIPIEDERLYPVWGDTLYRILLYAKQPTRRALWVMKITQG